MIHQMLTIRGASSGNIHGGSSWSFLRIGSTNLILSLKIEGEVSELIQPRILDADPSRVIFWVMLLNLLVASNIIRGPTGLRDGEIQVNSCVEGSSTSIR